ncbi:MAG TPA: MFS transporter [candidate division WOR-3 bacterium]|uniref:MFS transporter n=1 Tax=candidate division WOR-3 bacterium TaxID=2052148 RepID=A0A9C9EMF3_UNCW3|nr:MFS transporter [candidate division WOR-3 bacterium]
MFFIFPQKISRGFFKYRANLRLFSRNARLFLIGTFFMGMGFSGFMLLFNLYLKTLGFPEGRIGNIISATTLGTVIMAIPASIVIRRVPIKRILLIATPIATFSYLIQITTVHYHLILTGGFAAGLAAVFSRVAAAPFFMRNSTVKERHYLFSMQFALMLVAGIVGNILAGFLPGVIAETGADPYLTYRYTLYIFSGLVLIALVPYFMIKESAVEQPKKFKIHSRRLILKLFLPNLVVGIGAGLSIPFFNLYFKEVFMTPTKLIGVFYSIQQFLMISGLLVAPLLAEKFGKIKTVVFSQLFSIPFFVILGLTHNLVLAVVAFLIRAALMNMAQPLFTNFAMEKVRTDEQPFTNALLVIAWTAGWGVSASIGGYLIEHFSYSVPFLSTSLLYLISTVIIFVFFQK